MGIKGHAMDGTSARVAAVLERQLGLATGSVGGRLLSAALRRRMDATGATDAGMYLRLLTTDTHELAELIEAVVVPETWFFRYAESFRHLAAWATRRKAEVGLLKPVRILSVPCSTGEEAYSIAIALLAAGMTPATFKVDAVDVSRRAVEFARDGVYAPTAFREAVDVNHSRYFDREGSDVVVVPEARAAVTFRVGNLIDPALLIGEQPFDVIFCRNLFIYLTTEARKTAVATFDRLLAPGGLVYMGHAEPLAMIDSRFKSESPPQAFVFRRASEANALGRPIRALTPAPGEPLAITAAVGRPDLPTGPRGSGPFVRPGAGTLSGRMPKPPAPALPPPPPPPAEPVVPLLQQAKAAADRGDVDTAVTLCEQSIRESGPNAEAYALLGALQLMGGNTPEAVRLFTQALFLDPSHYEALVHMMALAENRGDPKAAAQFRRRADAAARREASP